MSGPRPVRVLWVAVLVALLAGACESGPAASRATRPDRSETQRCARTQSGPSALSSARETSPGVTRVDLTLVDQRRSAPAVAKQSGAPCRVLPVEIRYPSGANAQLPLIVVAHGLDGDPTSLGPLLDAWAAAGYVVTAPTFPTTRKDRAGTSLPSNNVDQAADVTFVIDQLLEPRKASPTTSLRRLIDANHIGVAGMSLGGQTVYGLIANTCCEDRRVSAAIVMAGVHREYPGGKYERNRMPVLLVQGDADIGYHNSVEAYPQLVAPKWFITLHGARHAPPFEAPPGPEAPLVRATTIDFWNLYLKHAAGARSQLIEELAAARVRASLQRDLR